MLGEEVNLTLVFTHSNLQRGEIEEYEIEEPNFENIKSTLISDEEYQESNSTWSVREVYSLVPKQEGKLLIPPINLHIESIAIAYQKVYNRNKYLEKVDLQSKAIPLNVQSLPEGLKISGDYKLTAKVNEKKVKAGQPIRFTLTLAGEGNLENLDFFKLSIPHTTIYSETSKDLTKSFTIVSDRNYSIPAITLKYYNRQSHSVELIDSSMFSIEVDSDTQIEVADNSWFFYGLLLILLLLLCCYWLYINLKSPLIKNLKKTRSKEELLKKVFPYMEKSKRLKRLIYKLEIADSRTFKSLKKEIIREIHLHVKEKK